MRILSSLIALGLVAVVAGGCSSEAAPVPAAKPAKSTPLTTSPATSPTPSRTPTEQPPRMPAAAKGQSKAAAKAFVRYYVDVFNFAESTGRVAPLARLTSEQCRRCLKAISFLRSTYAGGGRIDAGRGWSILQMVSVPGETIFAVRLHEDPVRWSTGPDTKFSRARGHNFTLEI